MKWPVDIINGIGLQDQMLVETRVPGLFLRFSNTRDDKATKEKR